MRFLPGFILCLALSLCAVCSASDAVLKDPRNYTDCNACISADAHWCKSNPSLVLLPTDGRCISKGADCFSKQLVKQENNCPLGVSKSLWGVFSFFVCTLSAWIVGLVFQMFKFPVITGYLLLGTLLGPFMANMIQRPIVTFIGGFVQHFALAFISISAGLEIYYPELRNLFKTLLIQMLFIFVATFVGVTAVTTLFGTSAIPLVAFIVNESVVRKLAISMLAGVLMVAPSPASALAVITEMRSKGPFTSMVIGMTVISDVVVVVVFAIILPISTSLCSSSAFDWWAMLVLVLTLGACAFFGVAMGYIFLFVLWLPAWKKDRQGWFGVPSQIKGAIIILLGWGFFEFSTWLSDFTEKHWVVVVNLEPILALIIASSLAGNTSSNRRKFANILHKASPYVFVPFFTMTGAGLDLDAVKQTYYVGFLWWTLRIVLKFGSSFLAGKYINRMPPRHYRYLWMTTLAQAGVTLGLGNEVRDRFATTWGPSFNATIVAVVVLNQIFGPILCKYGVRKAGEAPENRKTPPRVRLVGDDRLAVDVARTLCEQGVEVQVVLVKELQEPMAKFWAEQSELEQTGNFSILPTPVSLNSPFPSSPVPSMAGSVDLDRESPLGSDNKGKLSTGLSATQQTSVFDPDDVDEEKYAHSDDKSGYVDANGVLHMSTADIVLAASDADSLVLLLPDTYNLKLCRRFHREKQMLEAMQSNTATCSGDAEAATPLGEDQRLLGAGAGPEAQRQHKAPQMIALMVDPRSSRAYQWFKAVMVHPYVEMIAYLAMSPELNINHGYVAPVWQRNTLHPLYSFVDYDEELDAHPVLGRNSIGSGSHFDLGTSRRAIDSMDYLAQSLE